MPTANQTNTVNDAFFHPLNGLSAQSEHTRCCPEISDEQYVLMGVCRVLESTESGRGFLQEHGNSFSTAPTLGAYFANLHSPRRCAVLKDVDRMLYTKVDALLEDRLADIPELGEYEVFAADGHWHKAAAHDERHESRKMAVGHFYSLNLRTHALLHLATGQGLHEHDMSALKRVNPRGLRMGVPKGRRVLLVYDKAGVDLAFWKRCRKECGVYFLSQAKENMVFEWIESLEWDRQDARNHGVKEDWVVRSRQGDLLRLICYIDPLSGVAYEFLTNEMDLPPGVLVELYRRRWEVEKVFDEVKNKLGEKKAWASSLVAKEAQARSIVMTHNLLIRYEQDLANRHGVKNEAEDKRRENRTAEAAALTAKKKTPLSSLVLSARAATQRSVKFIRWLRQALRLKLAEAVAVLNLKAFYAKL
jgi:hypothetical protein